MDNTRKNISPTEAFKVKEFQYFITGRFLFIMGFRMTSTIIGWWIYTLTKSVLALGLVGLSEVIAALSFALYAGHYIDRNENRKLLLSCILFYLGCIFILFFLSDKSINTLHPWVTACCVFLVIGCTGIIRAFSGPTFSSLISKVVPKHLLPSATTISSATWLTGSILGHAMGGFLIAIIGIHFTFIVVLMFVMSGYLLLRNLRPKAVNAQSALSTWQSVKEGVHYVFKSKEILGALSLDLFAVLFGGAAAMVPVFAKDILHVGPHGFGWLNAATDIGAIITVSALTFFPLKRKQGKFLFFSIAGFGICIIVFALSTTFWISFLALMLSGCLDGVSVVVRGTILQLKTPDELRGRVMSVNSMFINSSNELGQFESGVMAKIMGIVPSVVFGGIMTIGVVIATWIKAPNLRKMEY